MGEILKACIYKKHKCSHPLVDDHDFLPKAMFLVIIYLHYPDFLVKLL